LSCTVSRSEHHWTTVVMHSQQVWTSLNHCCHAQSAGLNITEPLLSCTVSRSEHHWTTVVMHNQQVWTSLNHCCHAQSAGLNITEPLLSCLETNARNIFPPTACLMQNQNYKIKPSFAKTSKTCFISCSLHVSAFIRGHLVNTKKYQEGHYSLQRIRWVEL
jgi:hypothetical protein